MKLKYLALAFLFLLLNSPNQLVEAANTPDGGSSSDGADQVKALMDTINKLTTTVGSLRVNLTTVTDALTKMKADSKKLDVRVKSLESSKPKTPASSSKTVPIVLLVVLLVGAVVGAYYYAHKNGGIGVVAVRAFGAMRS
eukprot:96174_1